MVKVVICYGSAAKLKEHLNEVNSLVLDIADDWEFTSEQIVTSFTENDNFIIRLNLLGDTDSVTILLSFARQIIKSMNRFILSSEVNFVSIC